MIRKTKYSFVGDAALIELAFEMATDAIHARMEVREAEGFEGSGFGFPGRIEASLEAAQLRAALPQIRQAAGFHIFHKWRDDGLEMGGRVYEFNVDPNHPEDDFMSRVWVEFKAPNPEELKAILARRDLESAVPNPKGKKARGVAL